MRKRAFIVAVVLVAAPGVAWAQEEESRSVPEGTDTPGNYLINRKHTVAEAEVGIIALPAAPISSGQSGGNTPFGTIGKGDATIQTGLHLLYRGGAEWAIGAGALFAPRPTKDDEYGGAHLLSRTHARSYLQFAGEARYIPIHLRTVEGWVGVTVGGVIVADRFVTNAGDSVPPILGSKETTVSSEGFSFGAALGADWLFAERLVAGFALRLDRWILPETAACTPIKDCATLTGPVEAIEFGIKIGYRLPL
jgi:hypothetical protein